MVTRMLWWMLLVVCELRVYVSAGHERDCLVDDTVPHPFGICGNHLTEMLGTLCIFGYNEHPHYRRKRESRETDRTSLRDLLLPKAEANSYLEKRSEYLIQGITCECCYNRCGIMELLSYCKSGP